MQHSAIYILSLLISIQSIGFSADSFAGLDDFWAHYQTHQQENGDDLLRFIDLHYGSGRAEHQDKHDEHEQLPFGDIHSVQVLIVFLNFSEINLKVVEFKTQKHSNFNYQEHYISALSTEVFQPPKHF